MKERDARARAMHVADSREAKHSDFKSPNVFITRDWTAKISDFGGSRNLASNSATNNFLTVTHIGTTR